MEERSLGHAAFQELVQQWLPLFHQHGWMEINPAPCLHMEAYTNSIINDLFIHSLTH